MATHYVKLSDDTVDETVIVSFRNYKTGVNFLHELHENPKLRCLGIATDDKCEGVHLYVDGADELQQRPKFVTDCIAIPEVLQELSANIAGIGVERPSNRLCYSLADMDNEFSLRLVNLKFLQDGNSVSGGWHLRGQVEPVTQEVHDFRRAVAPRATKRLIHESDCTSLDVIMSQIEAHVIFKTAFPFTVHVSVVIVTASPSYEIQQQWKVDYEKNPVHFVFSKEIEPYFTADVLLMMKTKILELELIYPEILHPKHKPNAARDQLDSLERYIIQNAGLT